MALNENSGRAQAGGVGRWTRLSLAFQVALVLVLAFGAAVLVIHVSEWRGLRHRFDLTLTRRNTADPALVELLRKLPEPVSVDVFFRPLPQPYLAIGAEVQGRTHELLAVLDGQLPGSLDLRDNDLTDLAAAKQRMAELGLEEVNVLVVHMGQRRAVLNLFEELAEVELGNPDPRAFVPPRLVAFRGQEALAQALARVSSEGGQRVLFSTGHGEADPFGGAERDLSRLRRALEADGFEVGSWDSRERSAVPEDCAALAVVGNEQPFDERELEAIGEHVAGGGRLLVATAQNFFDGQGSAAEILRPYGMLAARGLICEPVVDAFGRQSEGTALCADLRIGSEGLNASHPVTEPLWKSDRRLRYLFGRSFDRGTPRDGGILQDLLSSTANSWRDLPGATGQPNFALEQGLEELARFRLAMSLQQPLPGSGGEEARVVGLAAESLLSDRTHDYNGDLALNLFNWLVDRDFRVRVSTRDVERSRIDVERGGALSRFTWLGWIAPSVLSLLSAFAIAWRRKR